VSEVNVSIDIAAPRQAVYDFMLDPERLHEWVTIHRALLESDHHEPPQTGDSMEQRLCIRGASFKVSWELTTGDRPFHAMWKGKGPARSKAETEYTLEETDDGGTRFLYRNAFSAPFGPLGSIASKALVGGVPEREANESLRRMKSIIEREQKGK
jgi:uncharacterized protein YndB with AHSA1/START domain